MDDGLSTDQVSWPESYAAPSLLPLGSVWSQTGGATINVTSDNLLRVTP